MLHRSAYMRGPGAELELKSAWKTNQCIILTYFVNLLNIQHPMLGGKPSS